MASKYPAHSPYIFVLNNSIVMTDPDGNDPIYGKYGQLIGYRVEKGQGPTQIAKDLNDNYNCELKCSVKWNEIVHGNKSSFKNVYQSKNHNVEDKYNPLYKSGNINPSDILVIDKGKIFSLPQYEDKVVSLKEKILGYQKAADTYEENMDHYAKDFSDGAREGFKEGGIGIITGAALTYKKNYRNYKESIQARDNVIKELDRMECIIYELKNADCNE